MQSFACWCWLFGDHLRPSPDFCPTNLNTIFCSKNPDLWMTARRIRRRAGPETRRSPAIEEASKVGWNGDR